MRIVVLMGGDSSEREVSLVSGDQIASALADNGHDVIKMDPAADRDGQTELNKTDLHWIGIDYPDFKEIPPHQGTQYLKNILIIKRLKTDIVFNALHGGKGEDGVVQGMLDAAGIRYTGSGRTASTLAMQKDISKEFFRKVNIPTARSAVLDRPGAALKHVKKLPAPLVVKANDQGSTIGLYIVNDHSQVKEAAAKAFGFSSKVLVEEFIPGRELAVTVLKKRVLPIVEIKPKHDLYDYECKYKSGMSEYFCPAEMDLQLTQKIQSLALKAHTVLGCKGYSRVDFLLTKDNQPFILELNTLPGMTPTSLVPKAARAAGINFNELLETIVEEGMKQPYRVI